MTLVQIKKVLCVQFNFSFPSVQTLGFGVQTLGFGA